MKSRHRILVTPRSLTRAPHPAVQLLRDNGCDVILGPAGRQPTEDELLELLPGCAGYLAGVEPVTARVLEAAPGLIAISRNGIGVDSIDSETAERAGVRILTTPGANAEGVAELAIGLLLALVRSIPLLDRVIKDGGWNRRIGMELDGAVLGVIGCGNVGKRVSELALGLGMTVLGHDPYPTAAFHPAGFSWVAQDELLERSVLITLHSPATGKPTIDAPAIARMRAGTYLVNTARAGLVDSDALLEALDSGRIAGYAVDAYEQEPPTDRRIVEHSSVIATPHIGGYTEESVARAATGAAQNLLAALQEGNNG